MLFCLDYCWGADFLWEAVVSQESEVKLENGSTSSDSAWRVAKGWLEDCVFNHDNCNQSDPDFLPTRVIDVGNESDDSVHLCEVKNTPSYYPSGTAAPYMTLSHSWGKKKFLILLTSNLEEFKNTISLKSLTKTFQDAITITRRCNIRYLWIDSLCIIQDSKEDWETESAMMAALYENTYLNIAATAARDGDDGCFSMRNPLSVENCFVTVHTQLEEDLNYLPLGQYVCKNSLVWKASVEDTPLGSRAWVVQERFLAPRTLHFGAQQLFWECCEKQFCEAHPDWSQQQFASNLKNNASLEVGMWTRELQTRSAVTNDQKRKIYALWDHVVFAYTSCALSEDTDKLVALSAIALSFQKRLRSIYLAGMWQEDLIHQLLWICSSPLERSPQYCAPTWSWASTKSVVLNQCNISDQEIRNTLATVEDAGLYFSGKNCLGALKGGSLCIRGFLVEGSLVEGGSLGERRLIVAGLDHHVEFDPDVVFSTDITPQKVFLLPIKGSFPGDGDDNNTELCGLVLQPAHKKGEFTRLGCFDIGTVRHATLDLKSCALLFARNDAIPALEEFQDGVRKYIMPEGSLRRQEWEWRQFRINII